MQDLKLRGTFMKLLLVRVLGSDVPFTASLTELMGVKIS